MSINQTEFRNLVPPFGRSQRLKPVRPLIRLLAVLRRITDEQSTSARCSAIHIAKLNPTDARYLAISSQMEQGKHEPITCISIAYFENT